VRKIDPRKMLRAVTQTTIRVHRAPAALNQPLRTLRSSAFACSGSQQLEVFDRGLKGRQRSWALARDDADYYDYLRQEGARQICERVEDITREFPMALELGAHGDALLQELRSRESLWGEGGGVGGVHVLHQMDLGMLPQGQGQGDTGAGAGSEVAPVDDALLVDISAPLPAAAAAAAAAPPPPTGEVPLVRANAIPGDEERPLRHVAAGSADLVLSNLSLHWINDLAGALTQVRQVLKPDGCFIGSLLGGSTLHELRYCLYLAEQERRGGVSPHASPLITPSDMAALMQGAQFALPTIDLDTVTVSYPDAFALMEHLSRMGEGTAALNRQFHVGRDTFTAAAAIYQELYGLEDGSIPATFQMIYVIGWAPHDSQPTCLKRGSATHSLKEIAK